MVWINDLDSTGCNVFVDGTIKSVSCDFMLPTLCEMDEHVRLTAFPSSVAELSLEVGHYLSTGYQDILLRPKMNCGVGLVNCFFVSSPSLPWQHGRRQQGWYIRGTLKKQFTKPTPQLILGRSITSTTNESNGSSALCRMGQLLLGDDVASAAKSHRNSLLA